MAYTKILWRNNKYVLQVKQHKDDPFIQLFASTNKSEVKKYRAKIQAGSINIEATVAKRNFVDV